MDGGRIQQWLDAAAGNTSWDSELSQERSDISLDQNRQEKRLNVDIESEISKFFDEVTSTEKDPQQVAVEIPKPSRGKRRADSFEDEAGPPKRRKISFEQNSNGDNDSQFSLLSNKYWLNAARSSGPSNVSFMNVSETILGQESKEDNNTRLKLGRTRPARRFDDEAGLGECSRYFRQFPSTSSIDQQEDEDYSPLSNTKSPVLRSFKTKTNFAQCIYLSCYELQVAVEIPKPSRGKRRADSFENEAGPPKRRKISSEQDWIYLCDLEEQPPLEIWCMEYRKRSIIEPQQEDCDKQYLCRRRRRRLQIFPNKIQASNRRISFAEAGSQPDQFCRHLPNVTDANRTQDSQIVVNLSLTIGTKLPIQIVDEEHEEDIMIKRDSVKVAETSSSDSKNHDSGFIDDYIGDEIEEQHAGAGVRFSRAGTMRDRLDPKQKAYPPPSLKPKPNQKGNKASRRHHVHIQNTPIPYPQPKTMDQQRLQQCVAKSAANPNSGSQEVNYVKPRLTLGRNRPAPRLQEAGPDDGETSKYFEGFTVSSQTLSSKAVAQVAPAKAVSQGISLESVISAKVNGKSPILGIGRKRKLIDSEDEEPILSKSSKQFNCATDTKSSEKSELCDKSTRTTQYKVPSQVSAGEHDKDETIWPTSNSAAVGETSSNESKKNDSGINDDLGQETDPEAVTNLLIKELASKAEKLKESTRLLADANQTLAELNNCAQRIPNHMCPVIRNSDRIQIGIEYESKVSSLAGLQLIFKHSDCGMLSRRISAVQTHTIQLNRLAVTLQRDKNYFATHKNVDEIPSKTVACLKALVEEMKACAKKLMIAIHLLMNQKMEFGYMLNASFIEDYNPKAADAIDHALKSIERIRSFGGPFVIRM